MAILGTYCNRHHAWALSNRSTRRSFSIVAVLSTRKYCGYVGLPSLNSRTTTNEQRYIEGIEKPEIEAHNTLPNQRPTGPKTVDGALGGSPHSVRSSPECCATLLLVYPDSRDREQVVYDRDQRAVFVLSGPSQGSECGHGLTQPWSIAFISKANRCLRLSRSHGTIECRNLDH